ncbi:MAG: DUF503 domain-containing protein [candidate division Zixibacteria bacterium HGW-Zixibacteria-1]|nr:MAG: DUF503 domain-containing protein [candidate division Zixibacteria bacterium HGW-Zixibacteria-1]
MVVGTIVVDLNLPGVNSLKEKRRRLKPLLAKLQSRFNVSVAEVGMNDIHRSAQVGVALVSNSKVFVDQVISSIVGTIASTPEINMVDYRVEIL